MTGNAQVSITGKERAKKIATIVLDIASAISGIFFVAVYIPYFCYHVSKAHFIDVTVSVLVFAGVLIPVLFRKQWKKLLKKGYLPVKILWCLGMCLYMITFLIFCVLINNHGDIAPEKTEKQQVVIVFGCHVRKDKKISSELRSRIECAAQVLKDYPDAICVASGGQGPDEGAGEGETIKNRLVSMEIEESRILVEGNSTDTDENIRFSLALLKEKGYDPENCSFICVSSGFHTPRIRLLFERNGISDCATVSAEIANPALRFIYVVREYMSYVHLWLFG